MSGYRRHLVEGLLLILAWDAVAGWGWLIDFSPLVWGGLLAAGTVALIMLLGLLPLGLIWLVRWYRGE